MNNAISQFVSLFEDLPDQRQEWKIKHKLVDIIFIAVVATIADCDDWEEMEWFAHEKESWFRKYIELPNGIPSHDTIERVFSWLDPNAFRTRFMQWTSLLLASSETKGIVAIDGKTMRGTKDAEKYPLHVVNAWFSETGMVLGQVFTEEKSNEITAIPELLKLLDISGQIVTMDAMGTQTEIAKKITEKSGDYVLAVKGNQPTLLDDIRLFFSSELEKKSSNILHIRKTEKGHGRVETRDYYTCNDTGWLDPEGRWAGLKSIGMVRRRSTKTDSDEETEEVRYYISSLSADASRFAYAVRQHWGVESMHWSLDMTFNEDRRRSRKDNAAKNLSQLLRLSYDILKSFGKQKKMPLKRMRKKALVDETYLEMLVAAVFGMPV